MRLTRLETRLPEQLQTPTVHTCAHVCARSVVTLQYNLEQVRHSNYSLNSNLVIIKLALYIERCPNVNKF